MNEGAEECQDPRRGAKRRHRLRPVRNHVAQYLPLFEEVQVRRPLHGVRKPVAQIVPGQHPARVPHCLEDHLQLETQLLSANGLGRTSFHPNLL